MLQSTSVKIVIIGLMLLLTACSSAAASQPAPVMEVKAAMMPAATAVKSIMAEQPAAKELMMEVKEEPALAAEAMAQPATVSGTAEPAQVESKSPEAEAIKDDAMMTETGPTAAQAQLLASLKNQGMPPELSNEVWLNSPPLKLADLHGKVVIVEFWTFGCINCKHVVPTLRQWHQTYQDEGLVIIGVHTPEFDYERDLKNVKRALLDLDIPYAVAIDNDWATWRAYNNRYWPAKYFIDKAGQLRHITIGEGRYEQQEEIIQALLAEPVS